MNLIEKLCKYKDLSDDDLERLIDNRQYEKALMHNAEEVRRVHYGTDVYIRGLIEISNCCQNNCFYCGIRSDNKKLKRYRLTKEQIISCCNQGYPLGFRTFVLQSGEGGFFSDEELCEIISGIKTAYPDCAVTLSLGEKSFASYRSFFDAGADRYLLRHETADEEHYRLLHPQEMTLENRRQCLINLKKIGFQVGSGFMVGSPGQTIKHLVRDLRFLQELQPDMIGIGPYISHRDTPFYDCPNGELHLCLRLIAILRLMFPHALIPSTTALGSITENGRELGLTAGANVVMPNLSPSGVRKLYEIYNNKLSTKEEAAEAILSLKQRVASVGYNIITDIGHVKKAGG